MHREESIMIQKRTAFITGASAGIGRSFAEILAKKKFELVLCARRENLLHEIANTLEEKYSIHVLVIAIDLADLNSCNKIKEILDNKGITVDLLINNAGYGLSKSFLKASWKELENYHNVMLMSVTKLSHLMIPEMKARNYGRIINVSSIAAFIPEAEGSLYTGIKAYLLSFSKALAKEVAKYNIQVTALCPGLTYTEFHDVLGNRKKVSRLPKFLWMDSTTVAEQGLNAVMKGKTVYINGVINKLIVFLAYITPNFLLAKLSLKPLINKK